MAKARQLVVTAGPTREYLDPVRFLSNPSTGKMGFAVAAEAARRGYEVTLVAGPVTLKTPKGVKRVDVVSARDMQQAVNSALAANTGSKQPILIATAAVADWRPARCARQKLKKQQMTGVLKLVRNPDILKSVKGAIKVGFAAETDDILSEAARKCKAKRLAFIVANDVTEKGSGFGSDTNRVTFVFPNGECRKFPCLTKSQVAKRILNTLTDII